MKIVSTKKHEEGQVYPLESKTRILPCLEHFLIVLTREKKIKFFSEGFSQHLFLVHFFRGVLVFVIHVQYIYVGNFINMLYAAKTWQRWVPVRSHVSLQPPGCLVKHWCHLRQLWGGERKRQTIRVVFRARPQKQSDGQSVHIPQHITWHICCNLAQNN